MALTLKKTLPDNTLTQGETLSLTIEGEPSAPVVVDFAGPSTQQLTGTCDASTGLITLTADTTSWTSGEYLWESKQTKSDGTVERLQRQRFTLITALSNISPGTDIRTTAEQAVAMLEASLSGSATAEVENYKINNRELRRYSIPERLQLLSFWRREVSRQRRISRGVSGLGASISARI